MKLTAPARPGDRGRDGGQWPAHLQDRELQHRSIEANADGILRGAPVQVQLCIRARPVRAADAGMRVFSADSPEGCASDGNRVGAAIQQMLPMRMPIVTLGGSLALDEARPGSMKTTRQQANCELSVRLRDKV